MSPEEKKAATKEPKKQAKVPTSKPAQRKPNNTKKPTPKSTKNNQKKEMKDLKTPVKTEATEQKKETNTKKKPTLPAVVGRGLPKQSKKNAVRVEKTTGRKVPAELPTILKSQAKAETQKKEKQQRPRNIHIVARPKSFHIGGDLPPKRDVSRMVKWPKYIRLQRKKKIMYTRLKVPPMIHQFTQTLDKHAAKVVLRFLGRYRPESDKKRKARLLALAQAKRAGKKVTLTKPYILKHGASQIAHLVEQKKAKLVIIANDVDPIEHVLFLPTLCRKMRVPYCIIKNKARLGRLVRLKTCSAMALTHVRPEDKIAFGAIQSMAKNSYNKQAEHIVRTGGGGKLGLRSSIALKKREEALKKASLDKQNE